MADSHLSFDEIGHVAIIIDTSGAKPRSCLSCAPSRQKNHPQWLLQQGRGAITCTEALDYRNEPAMRNLLQQEVLQKVVIPNELSSAH